MLACMVCATGLVPRRGRSGRSLFLGSQVEANLLKVKEQAFPLIELVALVGAQVFCLFVLVGENPTSLHRDKSWGGGVSHSPEIRGWSSVFSLLLLQKC